MLATQLHGVTHQERRMVDPPEAAGAQERRFDVRQERDVREIPVDLIPSPRTGRARC